MPSALYIFITVALNIICDLCATHVIFVFYSVNTIVDEHSIRVLLNESTHFEPIRHLHVGAFHLEHITKRNVLAGGSPSSLALKKCFDSTFLVSFM